MKVEIGKIEQFKHAEQVNLDNYIYLNPNYLKAIAKHENSEVHYIYIERGNEYFYFPFLMKDISTELPYLSYGEYFDISNPFDYGGFIYSNKEILRLFNEVLLDFANRNNIISLTLRFCPLYLKYNDKQELSKYFSILYETDHVVINLTNNWDTFFKESNYSNRKSINKAIRSNGYVRRFHDLNTFYELFSKTMKTLNGNSYFIINKSAISDLYNEGILEFWSSGFDDQIVTILALLKEKENLYSYLIGNNRDGLKVIRSNFIYSEIVKEYSGKKQNLFLGGGSETIFRFKSNMSTARRKFIILSKVFNHNIYNDLVIKTKKEENDFFPKYREKII